MQKQVNIIGGTHTISAHDFNANYVYYHELGRKYPDVICAWQAKEERGESRVLVVCPIFKSTGEAPELLLKAKASTYENYTLFEHNTPRLPVMLPLPTSSRNTSKETFRVAVEICAESIRPAERDGSEREKGHQADGEQNYARSEAAITVVTAWSPSVKPFEVEADHFLGSAKRRRGRGGFLLANAAVNGQSFFCAPDQEPKLAGRYVDCAIVCQVNVSEGPGTPYTSGVKLLKEFVFCFKDTRQDEALKLYHSRKKHTRDDVEKLLKILNGNPTAQLILDETRHLMSYKRAVPNRHYVSMPRSTSSAAYVWDVAQTILTDLRGRDSDGPDVHREILFWKIFQEAVDAIWGVAPPPDAEEEWDAAEPLYALTLDDDMIFHNTFAFCLDTVIGLDRSAAAYLVRGAGLTDLYKRLTAQEVALDRARRETGLGAGLPARKWILCRSLKDVRLHGQTRCDGQTAFVVDSATIGSTVESLRQWLHAYRQLPFPPAGPFVVAGDADWPMESWKTTAMTALGSVPARLFQMVAQPWIAGAGEVPACQQDRNMRHFIDQAGDADWEKRLLEGISTLCMGSPVTGVDETSSARIRAGRRCLGSDGVLKLVEQAIEAKLPINASLPASKDDYLSLKRTESQQRFPQFYSFLEFMYTQISRFNCVYFTMLRLSHVTAYRDRAVALIRGLLTRWPTERRAMLARVCGVTDSGAVPGQRMALVDMVDLLQLGLLTSQDALGLLPEEVNEHESWQIAGLLNLTGDALRAILARRVSVRAVFGLCSPEELASLKNDEAGLMMIMRGRRGRRLDVDAN